LPPLVATVTGGFLLFSNSIGGIATKLAGFAQGTGMFASIVTKLTGGVTGLTGAFGALSLSSKFVIGGGLVAGLTAVAWGVEKLVSSWAQAKKSQDEANVAMEDALSAFNSQGQNIDVLIDRYEELATARKG